MSLIPIALWNLKVPSGGAKIPGYDDEERSPWPYRITMAAIDSSTLSSKPSTLKLHKRVVTAIDEDDEDEDTMDDDKESIEEEFVICTLEAGKVNLLNCTPFDCRRISKRWILLCQKTMRFIFLPPVICTCPSWTLLICSPIYLSGNYVARLN